MAPTLIIDGYNLIRNSPVLAAIDRRDIEEGREALLSRLAEYKRIRHLSIVVVFDGTGSIHLSNTRENRMGIQILFSRQGQTADDLIVSLARQKGRETVVITSDRGIHDRLKSMDCVCITSETFDAKIDNALYEFFKGESLEGEEVSASPPKANKKGTPRKLPKKARRQQAILRRL